MNRNIILKNIEEIADLISLFNSKKEICNFMVEILTESELETLSKRWCILKDLSQGETQRNIAKKYNVSLCKVTRGAKILKNRKSISTKYLTKE